MKTTRFITKNMASIFSTQKYDYQKPSTCPYCGVDIDAHISEKAILKFDDSSNFITLILCCTQCNKHFAAYYFVQDMTAKFVGMYPEFSQYFFNEYIQKLSPSFIDMFNQSLHAEDKGDYNLAAIGYRSALEILIKDYAINELNISRDEVASKNLFSCIGEYLHQDELFKSADVVRILGNDYVHYERKYPEHDFSLLKSYMDIFVHMITTKLMIAHPAVHRHS